MQTTHSKLNIPFKATPSVM